MKNLFKSIINYYLNEVKKMETMPSYNLDTYVEKTHRAEEIYSSFERLPKFLQNLIIEAETEQIKNKKEAF